MSGMQHRAVQRCGLAAAAVIGLGFPSLLHADLLRLELKDRTTALGADPASVVVVELYAVFDDPDDVMVATSKTEIMATADFIHHPGDRENTPLPLPKAVYDASGSMVDSFVTVGFAFGGGDGNPDGPDADRNGDQNLAGWNPDFCLISFLTRGIIDDCGGPANGSGAGWLSPPLPQSIAGKAGTYPGLEVLLARLSMPILDDCVAVTVSNIELVYFSPETVFSGPLKASIEICPPVLPDCNQNGVPDASEIAANPSLDCNMNLQIDSCEIAGGSAMDANGNGVPDECDPPANPADLNHDGTVDGADLGLLLAVWGERDRDADLNNNGVVDGADLGLLLAEWTGS